jgi:hypothetical protein
MDPQHFDQRAMSSSTSGDLNNMLHVSSSSFTTQYASAESSPTQSLSASQSASSFNHLSTNTSNADLYKSANSTANNSFNDVSSSSDASVIMAQSTTTTTTTPTIRPYLPNSTSSNSLNTNYVMNSQEYQSLPYYSENGKPNVKQIIDDTIKIAVNEKPLEATTATSIPTAQTPTKKSSSVMSFIEKMFVKSPTSLPPQSKPSELGLPKDLQSSISSSSPNPECSPYKLLDHELQQQQQQQQISDYQQNKPVSTLSPNGTTINDAVAIFNASNASFTSTTITTPSLVSTNTVDDALKKLPETNATNIISNFQPQTVNNPQVTSQVDNKIIESLALLNNHKEHERADPVLQSSMTKTTSISTNAFTQQKSEEELIKKHLLVEHANVSEKKISEPLVSNNMNASVPASSREFCMDLNFNLAAAAAVFAQAPIVISDNSKLPINTSVKAATTLATPSVQPTVQPTVMPTDAENKLTWNASTSSIHNDLKKILEDSKKEKPKPQRTTTNSHHKESTQVNVSNTETIDNNNSSVNLVKIMMKMIENNKLTNSQEKLPTQPSLETVLNSQKSKYRYTREVLHQIRNERAELINKIMPDIFKAYCYCVNGKLWDPEKYFDIVQFPGEDFEKLQRQKQQQQNSFNNNKNRYNNRSGSSFHKGANANGSGLNKKKPNNSTSSSNGADLLSEAPQNLQTFLSSIESPEPLQVPKNSPKSSSQHHKNHANTSLKAKKPSNLNFLKPEFETESVYLNILADTQNQNNEERTHADKVLLGLLNKTAQKPAHENVNLLDMLNTNKNQQKPVVSSTSSSPSSTNSSSNSVSASVKKHASSSSTKSNSSHIKSVQATQPRHYPLVLTAQELEMSQFNQQNNKKHQKSPLSGSITCHDLFANSTDINDMNKIKKQLDVADLSSDYSLIDLNNNNSNAYKQLVKNLSNHPLSAPPTSNKLTASSNNSKMNNHFFNKTQHKKYEAPNVVSNDDGSSILKQLLNINLDGKDQEKKTSSKPYQTKQHNHNHNHNSKKNKSFNKDLNTSNSFHSKSSESSKEKDAKFPAVNPHQKPFQSLLVDQSKLNPQLDNNKHQDSNPFENLIMKIKQSQLNQIMEIKKQEIDLKKKKVHLNTEYEHFNSLLNKIMPSISQQTMPNMPTSASTSFLSLNHLNESSNNSKHHHGNKQINTSSSSNNILKWFSEPVKN